MTWGAPTSSPFRHFAQQISNMKASLHLSEEACAKKKAYPLRRSNKKTTTTRLGITPSSFSSSDHHHDTPLYVVKQERSLHVLPRVLEDNHGDGDGAAGAAADHWSVTSEITMEPLPPAPRPHDSSPMDDIQEEQHATITLKPSCYTSTEALIHYQSKRIQALELRSRVDEEELEGLRRKYQELQSVHQMQAKEWEIRQERYDKQIQYLTDRMECFERYLKVVDESEVGVPAAAACCYDDSNGSVPMLIEESVNSSSCGFGGGGFGGDALTATTTTTSRTGGLFRSFRASRSSKMDSSSSSIHDSSGTTTPSTDLSYSNDSSSSSHHPTNNNNHRQLHKAQQTIRALMGQIQLVERMLGEETNSLREQLLQQQHVQVRMESEYQLQLQQLQHSKRKLERALLEHHKRANTASSSTGATTASSSVGDGTDTDATPQR